MTHRQELTIEALSAVADYDPLTGIFTRKKTCLQYKAGDRMGGVFARGGQRKIVIKGKSYHASHLAHLWMTGSMPKWKVRHKNGDNDDDRWVNLALREAKSGYKGVCKKAEGVWQAKVSIKGKRAHIGLYDTPEKAYAAYLKAKADPSSIQDKESKKEPKVRKRKSFDTSSRRDFFEMTANRS